MKRVARGDIDGLIGILIDNLSVFLLLISLNLYVVGMPEEIVFGRILPGAAIGLLGGNLYYVYMAKRMMKQEQRDDVTALPSGVSIVFVITYTMGILLPVARMTGDPEMAWRIGLAANIIGALICVAGAFIGPVLKRFLPTVSMLGPVAGLAIIFIAGAGMKDIFSNPVIGFVALGIIIWGYVGNGKLPFHIPAGLFALVIGAVLAFFMGQTAVDMDGVGLHLPRFWIFHVGVQAFEECLPYLAVIIPVAVLNFITTLNDVESAASVGDDYNLREAMLVDAAASALSAVFGCCYPNCVFIGHPGYKRMGARISYSLVASIIFVVLAFFGLFSLINSVIPLAAVTPILIFVGLVNIEVAFTVPEKKYIPAAAMALLPFVGEYAKEQIDSAVQALGYATPLSDEILQALAAQGINYTGFTALAHGTIILSMLFAAMVVFVIDRKLHRIAIIAGIGAACSFVGLIHSAQLALNPNPQLTIAWLIVAAAALVGWLFHKKQPDSLGTRMEF